LSLPLLLGIELLKPLLIRVVGGVLFFFLKKRFIYLFDRAMHASSGGGLGGGQRDWRRESQANSQLSTEPDAGFDLTTLRS